MSFNECSNTDIEKVFELILKTAVNNRVRQSEMPSKIYIISDMEFDWCTGKPDATNFENAKERFAKYGYRLPEVIFWNVNSRNTQQPVTKNDLGVALVSGCSPQIFRMLKVMRVFRTMRVFRVFKAARYSKSIEIIGNVIRNSTDALMAVGTLAFLYVIISALIVFNIEPDTFNNFFEAIYWATVSLTTVGYGDIYPITNTGKFVAMVSSIFGIAIVALPSGIITAGYMEELAKMRKEKTEKKKGKHGEPKQEESSLEGDILEEHND